MKRTANAGRHWLHSTGIVGLIGLLHCGGTTVEGVSGADVTTPPNRVPDSGFDGATTSPVDSSNGDGGAIDSSLPDSALHGPSNGPVTSGGRPVATACAANVYPWDRTDGGASTCNVDGDCNALSINRYCRGGQCAADTCLSDRDCQSGQACVCANQIFGNAPHGNKCIAAGCHMDADCGPAGQGSCSLTSDGACGRAGFACRTPQDKCHVDQDCGSRDLGCNYAPALGYWTCQATMVCGGG